MIKILKGVRQTGATTRLIKMMADDYKNTDYKIGIVCKGRNYNGIIRRVACEVGEDIFNVKRFVYLSKEVEGCDKYYIMSDLADVSEDMIEVMSHWSDEIYCNKSRLQSYSNCLEYVIAVNSRVGDSFTSKALEKLTSINFNFKKYFEIKNSILGKFECEFIEYNPYVGDNIMCNSNIEAILEAWECEYNANR